MKYMWGTCVCTLEIQIQSCLVGTCQILIEISPNREKGTNLTELFNSLLKEQCVNIAGSVQPSCSKITVGVHQAAIMAQFEEIAWALLAAKAESENREELAVEDESVSSICSVLILCRYNNKSIKLLLLKLHYILTSQKQSVTTPLCFTELELTNK